MTELAKLEQANVADTARRRLARSYIIGLLIVASAVTSTFFILSALISAQSESAWLINISGRQRMLSQRIALLSVEFAFDVEAQGEAALRDQLDHDLSLLLSSHDALIQASGGRDGMSDALRRLYFERIDAVDPAVRAYAAQAQALLRLSSPEAREQAARALSRDAKSSLLNGLNAIVLQLQTESEARIRFLERLEFAVYLITLLGIAAEVVLVFRPTLRELHRRARAMDLLSYQASHDELTGLPNRRYFLDFAENTLAVAARKGHHTGVLHIDLDGFKEVNDDLGHAAGDKVLRWVAHQLRDTVRRGDFLARLGGDEFVVLVSDVQSPEELEHSADRLIQALEAPDAQAPPCDVRAAASIGLALMAPGERAIEPLLRMSDRALYRAKSAGRSRWCWSSEPLPAGPDHD